ncbi:MAG: aldo/keto reductase [Pseudomonadota bacterium]
MDYRTLGTSDLNVSHLCLGSMTWGTQNTEAEGHAQIDLALDHGVNFIDTAEMYPVNPTSAETQGDSERILGTWIEKSGRRKDIVLATKICGAGYGVVRGGAPISSKTLAEAVDGSLQRLKTDYIDLYQLHWPNRGSFQFRQYWNYDPSHQVKEDNIAHMEDVLGAMGDLVKAGKIRHIGLSNESAWGVTQWCRVAEENNLPRMVTIQNEYSLMYRLGDTDLAEACHNEKVDMICYSPLVTGMITGKYLDGQVPAKSRGELSPGLFGRLAPRSDAAVRAYMEVAEEHGLDIVHLALAFAASRPFMGSVIFGARADGQLERILDAHDVTLSKEVFRDIDKAHRAHPMPF